VLAICVKYIQVIGNVAEADGIGEHQEALDHPFCRKDAAAFTPVKTEAVSHGDTASIATKITTAD
jgi:hypothetical protein